MSTQALYGQPAEMTDLAPHREAVAALPGDVPSLAAVVQGLLVHRAWAPMYGLQLPERRLREEGLRSASAMLSGVLRLSGAPLHEARPPEQRMIANCRHFATLLTALLRHRGVPARARCGFASYFEAGRHVDHWICEWWDGGRWVQSDAQVDARQRDALQLPFDPLDLPAGAFLSGGQAWQRCRDGSLDPERCGIGDMWGLWFVGGDLMLDLASLNRIELLPWDPWDAGVEPGGEFTDAHLAMFDDAASVSGAGDATALPELYGRYLVLEVPNALLERARAEDAQGGVALNPIAAD